MKNLVKIKVLPRSSKNQIIKLSDDSFKIKLTATPVDGEANKKLIAFLSKEWKIPKSKIEIVRGLTSKNKTVGIKEYDWNLLHRNIKDFKEDRESMMPCIDIIPEQVDKLITDFQKIDMLIIDGLYALKAKNIDMKIYIDLTYHETKLTQIVRGKETMDDFRAAILEREHLNVLTLKPKADFIINKSYQLTDPNTGEEV